MGYQTVDTKIKKGEQSEQLECFFLCVASLSNAP